MPREGCAAAGCARSLPVVPSLTFTADVMRHTPVCHMMTRCLTRVIVGLLLLLAPTITRAQTPDSTRVVTAARDTSERSTPFAAFSASALALRDSLVALARAQIGRRYVLGGESPERGFDCSGLVKYLTAALNVKLPRTAAQQAAVGAAVPKDTASLQPGDLLLFGSAKRISHIGIYIGEGRFIHASSAAGKVIESRLLRPPARRIKPWRGARRLVPDSTVATADAGPA